MAKNIEIKARLRDSGKLESQLIAMQAEGPWTLNQTDTFFHTPTGRLKLRVQNQNSAELIFYSRKDSQHARLSEYQRVEIPDPETCQKALDSALGIRCQVIKQRRLYLLGQTRVHLDRVEHLGNYLELEVVLAANQSQQVGIEIAQELMTKLNIEPDDLVSEAYADLLETQDA